MLHLNSFVWINSQVMRVRKLFSMFVCPEFFSPSHANINYLSFIRNRSWNIQPKKSGVISHYLFESILQSLKKAEELLPFNLLHPQNVALIFSVNFRKLVVLYLKRNLVQRELKNIKLNSGACCYVMLLLLTLWIHNERYKKIVVKFYVINKINRLQNKENFSPEQIKQKTMTTSIILQQYVVL